jgi:hypothetical protein
MGKGSWEKAHGKRPVGKGPWEKAHGKRIAATMVSDSNFAERSSTRRFCARLWAVSLGSSPVAVSGMSVRHGDVGAARVGHHQRTARLPKVAFGIEMQHLWAHARIAGALQNAAAADADRIAQRRIAERELVIAVRVVLVLARVAPRLRKLPVNAGAARSRHDGKDALAHLASGSAGPAEAQERTKGCRQLVSSGRS